MVGLQTTRKSDVIHHRHHPEGVVYRSFRLNSNTFAVSDIASRRWWSIESLFPTTDIDLPWYCISLMKCYVSPVFCGCLLKSHQREDFGHMQACTSLYTH